MNENMTIVVEALRSGDYKQTSGRLRRNEDKFCCLGVMCDKYHEITGDGRWTLGGLDELDIFEAGDIADVNYASGSDLPDVVRDWVGLKGWAGSYGNDTETTSLMRLNDTGKTFAEIADIIESEPEGLFT